MKPDRIWYTAGMSAARRHYERAFEAALVRSRLPYLLVDDAKRAVLEPGARLGVFDEHGTERRLKSFDAVVYGPRRCTLVEVKGRRVDLRRGGTGRRESWTTMDDIRSLRTWERLFGDPFEAVLVFLYWLDGPALKAGETGLLRFEGRVYAHRAVRLSDYAREMKVRSPRWRTVDLPAEAFERIGYRFDDLIGVYSDSLAEAKGTSARGSGVEPIPAGA